jgi:hypothetical protein
MRQGQNVTYPIQNHINMTSGVDDGRLATQLHDLTQHAHNAVLELRQVRSKNTWGLRVVHYGENLGLVGGTMLVLLLMHSGVGDR